MKIGLNATCLNDRPSGASQRFAGIYRALVQRLPHDEFIVYEPEDCRIGPWFGGAPNVVAQPTPLSSDGRVGKFLAGLRYWPSELKRETFDIFEAFNLPLVKPPTGRTILTIHDIRRMHSGWSIVEKTAYRFALESSLRAADHIITVSATMKDEILSFWPWLSISVVYNGLDPRAFHAPDPEALRAVQQKFRLPQQFVLAVGHLEKRKNYARLVDAIGLLRDRGRDVSLIIIGNDNGEKQTIERHIHHHSLADAVKILSGLSDLEVRCAYKLCDLFVFPSFYEGFGIPILEAMAAGSPMAVSDIAVFREITEGRAAYFRHDDVDSMAEVIETMLTSTTDRERVVEYGRARVKAFTFDALAANVEAVYRSLV